MLTKQDDTDHAQTPVQDMAEPVEASSDTFQRWHCESSLRLLVGVCVMANTGFTRQRWSLLWRAFQVADPGHGHAQLDHPQSLAGVAREMTQNRPSRPEHLCGATARSSSCNVTGSRRVSCCLRTPSTNIPLDPGMRREVSLLDRSNY